MEQSDFRTRRTRTLVQMMSLLGARRTKTRAPRRSSAAPPPRSAACVGSASVAGPALRRTLRRVGVVSGNYLFAEPLREHFAKRVRRPGRRRGEGGGGGRALARAMRRRRRERQTAPPAARRRSAAPARTPRARARTHGRAGGGVNFSSPASGSRGGVLLRRRRHALRPPRRAPRRRVVRGVRHQPERVRGVRAQLRGPRRQLAASVPRRRGWTNSTARCGSCPRSVSALHAPGLAAGQGGRAPESFLRLLVVPLGKNKPSRRTCWWRTSWGSRPPRRARCCWRRWTRTGSSSGSSY